MPSSSLDPHLKATSLVVNCPVKKGHVKAPHHPFTGHYGINNAISLPHRTQLAMRLVRKHQRAVPDYTFLDLYGWVYKCR